jgi:large subunit ribosomal protein L4
VNKKMRQKALFCVLSKKLADSQLRVIDSLHVSEPKTKQAFVMLSGLLQLAPRAKKIDAALIAHTQDTTLTRAARNLVKTKIMHPQSLDLYELINHKHILIDQEAIREIAAHYKKTTV